MAVIGGGLAGLSAAWALAWRGISVAVVEAKLVGWGASGRNGGFVSPGFAEDILKIERRVGRDHARALYSLSRQGVRFVADRISEFDRPELIGCRGWLKVIRHDRIDELARRRDRLAADYGVELDLWDRREVRDRLATKIYHGGLHDAQAFAINPLAYARALAAAAEQNGCRIFEGTRIGRIRRGPGGWQMMGMNRDGSSATLKADTLVIATSAYGSRLFADLDRAILPVATHVVVTEPLGSRLSAAIGFGGMIADTRKAGDYYRVAGAGKDARLLWGGRITTMRRPPASLHAMMGGDIVAVYPQLGQDYDWRDQGRPAGPPIAHGWSGLMGYTAKKMPVIGELAPGLWAATAFGGHGLNTTAMAGQLVAAGIGEADRTWELFTPFRPGMIDRLAAGNSVVGRAITQSFYWSMQARDALDAHRASG